jgi:hypothetical protein
LTTYFSAKLLFIVLRKCSQCQDLATGSGSTNKNEYVSFWIRWNNGVITVGHGTTPGVNAIITFNDNNLPHRPRFVAVASWLQPGEWTVSNVCLEPSTEVMTPADDTTITVKQSPMTAPSCPTGTEGVESESLFLIDY